MEKPYTGRATISTGFDGTQVEIPASRNILVMAFLGFWLCGWAFGEIFALKALLIGETPLGVGAFLLFWLGGWTVGGLYVLSTLWWMLRGREVITFTPGQMTIEKRGSLFAKIKTYDLNEVKKIRVQESLPQHAWGRKSNMNAFINACLIHFDYGLKTLQMAGGIDPAEARHIIEQLKSKHLLTDKNF